MKLRRVVLLPFLGLLAISARSQAQESQAPKERPTRTKVVLLGTGTSGPALCAVPKPLFLTGASRNWNLAT